MAVLDSLARLLAHGTESVRDGARAEADDLQAAVGTAAQRLEDEVLAPLGRALRPDGSVAARLAAIEERLARIESALADRDRTGR